MHSPIAYHLTARTCPGYRPFTETQACIQLWRALRREFPICYAAVIMPNHFHLVIPGLLRQKEIIWKMGIAMRSISRTLGPDFIRWSAAPLPQPVADANKCVLVMRYVHLNPVRARLTGDPLSWRWSTLREWVIPFGSHGWIDRPLAAGLHGIAFKHASNKILDFTLSDPFCHPDARKGLLPWNPELRPAPEKIRCALENLHYGETKSPLFVPTLLQAGRELGGLSIQKSADAFGLTRRGAQKALKRLPRESWVTQELALRTWLANSRFHSEPWSSRGP